MELCVKHLACVTIFVLWSLTGNSYARDDDEATVSEQDSFEIHMPRVHPKTEDYYMCSAHKVPDGINYITQYEALAAGDTAHHLLLYGCEEPLHSDGAWACGLLCGRGKPKIMFAWAKNAPPTRLPPDVGFGLGGENKVKYLVLQIHYRYAFTDDQEDDTSGVHMSITSKRQEYEAGVMILLSSDVLIRAHVPKIHADVSCQYTGHTELHPFAFRVHAHDLSTVITGYMYNSSWNLMGKGNPQWPQAFYPAESGITIKPNDYLVAQCTYDASNKDVDTSIGSTHSDEMCNFYFMYYTKHGGSTYLECFDNEFKNIAKHMPADSDVPPPRNPDLEREAHGHHHHMSGVDPQPETQAPAYPELNVVHEWPQISQLGDFKLGQVAGVALDSKGNVHVFHRGSREWGAKKNLFDNTNYFTEPDAPIAENVIVTFNPDGNVIDQWGKDMFYLPHGMYVDKDDNIWVTDVGMHQVFRFPSGSHTADRMLGTRMQPGRDEHHFCKPTDVTVISTGEVFITDGYCNNRVMKYSADGLFLKQWGTRSRDTGRGGYPTPSTFTLPHSITNVQKHNMVCVADRENARVQCFDYDGNFTQQYHPDKIKGPIYAVDYCPDYDVLLVVNGEDSYGSKHAVSGYTIDVGLGTVLQTWSPDNQGFNRPHDLTIGNQGNTVYVVEIGPNKIWKFTLNSLVKSHHGHPQSIDSSVDESTEHRIEESNQHDFGASIVIGALLVIPVLVIVIIVVFLRVRKQRRELGYKLVIPEGSDTESDGEDDLFVKTHPNNKHVTFSHQHARNTHK